MMPPGDEGALVLDVAPRPAAARGLRGDGRLVRSPGATKTSSLRRRLREGLGVARHLGADRVQRLHLARVDRRTPAPRSGLSVSPSPLAIELQALAVGVLVRASSGSGPRRPAAGRPRTPCLTPSVSFANDRPASRSSLEATGEASTASCAGARQRLELLGRGLGGLHARIRAGRRGVLAPRPTAALSTRSRLRYLYESRPWSHIQLLLICLVLARAVAVGVLAHRSPRRCCSRASSRCTPTGVADRNQARAGSGSRG